MTKGSIPPTEAISAIPGVDLTDLPNRKAKISAKLIPAATEVGFFCVTGKRSKPGAMHRHLDDKQCARVLCRARSSTSRQVSGDFTGGCDRALVLRQTAHVCIYVRMERLSCYFLSSTCAHKLAVEHPAGTSIFPMKSKHNMSKTRPTPRISWAGRNAVCQVRCAFQCLMWLVCMTLTDSEILCCVRSQDYQHSAAHGAGPVYEHSLLICMHVDLQVCLS